MRIGRSALGEQLSRLPITETLIRTRLEFPDLAGNLAAIEAICLENLEAKARVAGATVSNDDGWILTTRATSGRIVVIDEVVYFRIDEQRTSDDLVRDFRIDLTFDTAGRLDLALSLTQLRAAPRPSLYVPSVLSAILDKYRAVDAGTRVTAEPERFATAEEFSHAIFDLDRSLSLLVVSQPLSLKPDEINTLARRLGGGARVITLDDVDVSWGVTHAYGQMWSAFNGAIRVYAPGLIATEPSGVRAGRLFFGPALQEQLALDRSAVLDSVVEAALAPSSFWFAEEPLSSLDAALAERRKARRRQVGAGPAASALITPPAQPPEEPVEAGAADASDEISDLEAELVRLRAENEGLQRTNSVLRNERDELEQMGIEAEARSKELQGTVDALKVVAPATPLSGLSDIWATWIGELVTIARQASQDALELTTLREEASMSRAKAEALELALSQKAAATGQQPPIDLPRLGDLSVFEAYLAQKYPTVFALTPNGKRSFKRLIYDDPARFFSVIDLLGTTYMSEQRAGGQLAGFAQQAEQLTLKSTPSCSPITFNGELGQYHSVQLSDGSLAQMYELRDRGTSFERRHFLYIGFAYDPIARKVVLNTFEHPPTPSDRT